MKDTKSNSDESVNLNKTDSDDENGDNDYHANVASALLGSNW